MVGVERGVDVGLLGGDAGVGAGPGAGVGVGAVVPPLEDATHDAYWALPAVFLLVQIALKNGVPRKVDQNLQNA